MFDVVRDIVLAECKERLLACGRHASEQIDALVLSALRQLPPNLRDMPAAEALQLVGGSLAAGQQPLDAASPNASSVSAAAASAPGGFSSAHPQHPLVRLPPQYADVRWACDRCGNAYEGASFHCATCSFDLCDSCWSSTAEAGNSRMLSDKKRQDGHAPSSSNSANAKRLRPDFGIDPGAAGISASVKSLGVPVDPMTLERMEELEQKTQEMAELSRILGDAPSRLERMPAEQRRIFMKRASDTCERLVLRGRADAGGA